MIFMFTLFLSTAFQVVGQRAHHIRSSVQFYFWLLLVVIGIPTFASSVRIIKELRQDGAHHTKHQEFRVKERDNCTEDERKSPGWFFALKKKLLFFSLARSSRLS